MLRSEPVTDYLAVLARDLDSDPALSRRVRGEVEDHLWQAAEARGGRSVENQLQAILSFRRAARTCPRVPRRLVVGPDPARRRRDDFRRDRDLSCHEGACRLV